MKTDIKITAKKLGSTNLFSVSAELFINEEFAGEVKLVEATSEVQAEFFIEELHKGQSLNEIYDMFNGV